MKESKEPVPYYLVKKHKLFGVEFYFHFTSDNIQKNFIGIIESNKSQESSLVSSIYDLRTVAMSRYQRDFNRTFRKTTETYQEFKDRKNGYLYKINFLVKETSLNRNFLKVTCYIKPSSSISQVSKGIKISINNWYNHHKLTGFKFKYKEISKNEYDIPKDKVLENAYNYFEVFNIKK